MGMCACDLQVAPWPKGGCAPVYSTNRDDLFGFILQRVYSVFFCDKVFAAIRKRAHISTCCLKLKGSL